uniref:Uncharacterized protein n=1 Tax=Anopheles quadriannulatus TaxID=34691 RepID=A0A182XU47_ANOQN
MDVCRRRGRVDYGRGQKNVTQHAGQISVIPILCARACRPGQPTPKFIARDGQPGRLCRL